MSLTLLEVAQIYTPFCASTIAVSLQIPSGAGHRATLLLILASVPIEGKDL